MQAHASNGAVIGVLSRDFQVGVVPPAVNVPVPRLDINKVG